MHPLLHRIFANRYDSVKAKFPMEGRRRWHLRVLEEFWEIALNNDSGSVSVSGGATESIPSDVFMQDDDPFDHFVEGPELGLLLRTDFTDEEAWKDFCSKLETAERELAETVVESDIKSESIETTCNDSEGDDSDDPTNGVPFPILKVVNPPHPVPTAFIDMSNITALRLFNDVDIRPSPAPPAGTRRITQPNRLVDQGKWQEIYTGVTIWIYDTLSNRDHCLRLVSPEGDFYGTATGDSWRVRGTHICEIQFNISFLGMTINFGGMDKWESNERRRNLEEANRGVF